MRNRACVAESGHGPMNPDQPGEGSLSATAAVALRWRVSGNSSATQMEAECAASVRALAVCLEADGVQPEGLPAERIEAKIDLLLLTLDRLSCAIDRPVSGDGCSDFVQCDVELSHAFIEWDEPLPLPADGTAVVIEVRAAPGHPVAACLPATLARNPPAALAPPGAVSARVLATLAPMPQPTRDAWERCVFILHRRAVKRAHGKAAPA